MPPVAMPAFAITTSMPPKRSTVPSHRALERLGVGHVALEPAAFAPHCAATRSSSSGSRPTSATLAPRAASPARRLGPDAAGGAGDQHCLPASRPVLHPPNPNRALASLSVPDADPRGPLPRAGRRAARARRAPGGRRARAVRARRRSHRGHAPHRARPAHRRGGQRSTASGRWSSTAARAAALRARRPGVRRGRASRRTTWTAGSGLGRGRPPDRARATATSPSGEPSSCASYGPRPVRQAAPQRAASSTAFATSQPAPSP